MTNSADLMRALESTGRMTIHPLAKGWGVPITREASRCSRSVAPAASYATSAAAAALHPVSHPSWCTIDSSSVAGGFHRSCRR